MLGRVDCMVRVSVEWCAVQADERTRESEEREEDV